jgi:aromatic-L-amino-acid decarboxylase
MQHNDPNEPAPDPSLADMTSAEFRRAAHAVADHAADYLERLESFRVLPDLRPGVVRAALPPEAPRTPEPFDAMLADYGRLIEPNLTHWQHPMFMAYFCSTASGPGILGEWLAAATNSNVMLWRNAPASTELEETVVGWLRGLLGLPPEFDGMLTDTASISTLLSVVAARQALPGLDAREDGIAGHDGPLRLYCSAEAHSSVEKAALVAGIGRRNVRRIPVDDEFRMDPGALDRAIAEDRAAGATPFCVVATLGTTSTTSLDPAGAIADVCAREKLWLHIDAAYGGSAALAPDLRPLLAGWERADSIVVNPHKWMFVPFDASLLLFRRPEHFRATFSLVPEYLRTPVAEGAHDFHEYGIQLGRRFRALKLWFHLRWFGAEGMTRRIREHVRLARGFADRIDAAPDWERLAPAPLSVVCFRHVPAPLRAAAGTPDGDRAIDAHNEALLGRVNAGGALYLSHTRLRGRFAIRLALGNPRAEERHLDRAWGILREAAGG